MENIKKFDETYKTFMAEYKGIAKKGTFEDLDKAEMNAVRMLQLMEVQVAYCGSDLADAVRARREDIRTGAATVTPIEKAVEEVKKPAKKAAKKAKK